MQLLEISLIEYQDGKSCQSEHLIPV